MLYIVYSFDTGSKSFKLHMACISYLAHNYYTTNVFISIGIQPVNYVKLSSNQ